MFKKILSVVFFTSFLISQAYAFEMVILDSRTEIIKADTGRVEKIEGDTEGVTKFQSIKEIITPDEISAHIPYNEHVGILNFNVLVPERAKIRVEVDNSNIIYPRFDTDIIFTRRGESRYLSFNVTKPSKGNIYLYNQDNQLIKTIRYSVKKERPVSQSMNVTVANPQLNSNNNTHSENYSVNYSIQQRARPGDPRWNMGLTYSSDLRTTDEQTKDQGASVSFGYSW